jgi:hypothetical protein
MILPQGKLLLINQCFTYNKLHRFGLTRSEKYERNENPQSETETH